VRLQSELAQREENLKTAEERVARVRALMGDKPTITKFIRALKDVDGGARKKFKRRAEDCVEKSAEGI